FPASIPELLMACSPLFGAPSARPLERRVTDTELGGRGAPNSGRPRCRNSGTVRRGAEVRGYRADDPSTRGRRARVPRAPRTASPRAAGALLPHARIAPRCRRRIARDDACGLAWPRGLRGALLAAYMALPDRDQPMPERLTHSPTPPHDA